jgi:hypothetical protein
MQFNDISGNASTMQALKQFSASAPKAQAFAQMETSAVIAASSSHIICMSYSSHCACTVVAE